MVVGSPSVRTLAGLHGKVIAVYVLLALGVTFPLVFHFTDHIVGDPQSDVWAHLWGFWRTEKALLQDHELPAQVEYINYPFGGVLYHIDLLNSLLMLPLKTCFGMVSGYNTLVLAHLVLAAYATFLLAYHLLRSPVAAALAGAAYAFNPYVTSMGLSSGVSERLNLAWIPLFTWFFFLALRTGKVRYSFFAGLMCLVTAMGCYKYGIFLSIFCLVLFAYLLAGQVRSKLRLKPEEFAQRRPERRRHLKAMVLTAGFCVISCVPLGLFARWLTLDSSALFHRDATMFWDGSAPLHGYPPFRLLDFMLPTDSAYRMSSQYDVLYQDTYVGLSLLILGIFSLFSRREHIRFFYPAAILFLVLALGPHPTSSEGANSVLSLVYQGFARVVPFFTFLHNPWEMALVVSCCLAVAAAGAFEVIGLQVRGRYRRIVLGTILAVVAGDTLLLRPTPMPAPLAPVEVSSFYRTLPDGDEDYALLDIPAYRPCSSLRPEEYLFFQTIHKKAIPYAINDSWMEEDPYWGALMQSQQCVVPSFVPQDVETARALDFLSDSHFRYLVLHEALLTLEDSRTLNTTFTRHLGTPVYRDSQLNVYQIRRVVP